MSISSEIVQHPDVVLDRSRPTKISHVVLNSARTDDQVPFFIDVLGFKLADSSHMMEFLRCSADHHSMAIFRNNGPSLNHVAYELPNIDGLMRGTGRLKHNGFEIEWGVGRHGPGNNVFSYFIEPNGFVAEYTTELDQLDDATHVPQDAALLAEGDADSRSLGNRRSAVEPHARRHVGRALSRRRCAARTSSGASSVDRPCRSSLSAPHERRHSVRPDASICARAGRGGRRPACAGCCADNPSPFTFKGTVSYIVGRGQVAIIDPGPDDAAHIAALLDAVRGETVTAYLRHPYPSRSFAGGAAHQGGDRRARCWPKDRIAPRVRSMSARRRGSMPATIRTSAPIVRSPTARS